MMNPQMAQMLAQAMARKSAPQGNVYRGQPAPSMPMGGMMGARMAPKPMPMQGGGKNAMGGGRAMPVMPGMMR